MISRRQWLGGAAAASALGFGARRASAAAKSASVSTRVAAVVVDERFEAAHPIARSLAAPDVPRVALPRDVLEFWHRRLAPLCGTGGQAIGGVTTERGFFLLRTLAADHRLRVHSRSLHGALVSWVIGPK